MYTSTADRPALNFPAATPADWTAARRRLTGWLRTRDVDADRAEEIAQAVLAELLTAKYHGDQCPRTPRVAAGWRIATAKRYGIKALTREGKRHSERRRRTGLDEPQPAADPVSVRDVAPSWTDPARMAEAGEALSERMPRLAMHARRIGTTPAGLALMATGWGQEQEPGTTPSITDCGPGYTPPQRGCPGLHTETDPRPTWHRYQPQPLTGDALARYREALADHYASR